MTLKIGIDNYSYHRFFGEVYPEQVAPEKNMTTDDFLAKAKAYGCDGVSLESCFIESFEDDYIAELKSKLDDYGFDRVWAWGHPDGLEGGKNEPMLDDMIDQLVDAQSMLCRNRKDLHTAEFIELIGLWIQSFNVDFVGNNQKLLSAGLHHYCHFLVEWSHSRAGIYHQKHQVRIVNRQLSLFQDLFRDQLIVIGNDAPGINHFELFVHPFHNLEDPISSDPGLISHQSLAGTSQSIEQG